MKDLKKIEIFTPRKEDVSKFNSVMGYIKKKIVSKSGEVMGEVKDVLFTAKGVKGIIGGKLLSKFYIDSAYFNSVDGKIMLSIDPVMLLVGKDVFDADGRLLGKVIDVVRKSKLNNFKSIIVKRKFYSKGVEIPKSEIKTSKKNIILNKVYE
ncbi:hypothetical protein GOV06_03765 [Candidatus Woesearchaeota archaeon]|nr:hypothetical protein [Candidatus Woesearchaeota archaeon]